MHSLIFLQLFVAYGKAEGVKFEGVNSASDPKLKQLSPAYAILHDIFSNYDKRQRPVKGNQTLEVTINVRLNQLLKMV